MVLIQCSLSASIKFYTNIELNRLSDLLGLAKKSFVKHFDKDLPSECILNANATFTVCSVETRAP